MPEKGPKDILASETQQQGTLARTDQECVPDRKGQMELDWLLAQPGNRP